MEAATFYSNKNSLSQFQPTSTEFMTENITSSCQGWHEHERTKKTGRKAWPSLCLDDLPVSPCLP
ncbi:hypothetical protein OIU77_007409 [Salix suchowensis]|uniref:Uncharacterized protein n=1 Tax=Salix suchowensis TaxID=1278906 RepID=A0ABQ9AHA8_9ROSI|nr:hypothetical protein OIU77_007409 [Salix suchowensis]